MKRRLWLLLVPLALLALVLVVLRRTPVGTPATEDPRAGSVERDGIRASESAAPAPRAGGGPTNAPQKREVVLRAPWGDQVGALGRSQPEEGAPEGPMSFVMGAGGRLFVLDQVNGRISIFSPGGGVTVIPVPSSRFQDIDLDESGDPVLLDRVGEGSVTLVDASGSVKREITLAGEGVVEAGGVTSLHARADGVWVEYEHSDLVRIADASGVPDPSRLIQPGRATADGKQALRAELGPDRMRALVFARPLSAGNDVSLLAAISFDAPIAAITALETDARGRVFLAAHLLRETQGAPGDIDVEAQLLVVMDARGAELGRVALATPHGALEQFRPIRVGPDGAVYHLYATDEGAFMEKVWL